MKIINFNTSFGSKNMGDYIIAQAIKKELAFIFDHNFTVEYPTHTPVATSYQCVPQSKVMRYSKAAQLKFLDGTNIIKKSLLRPWPDWNINLFNCKPYRGVILVGAGMEGDFKKADPYTTLLYKKILSKNYIHSTRDERTKKYLESLGLKAINTGCATLWSLTPKKCKQIPTKKAKEVIFTITDYCPDKKHDKLMVETLLKEYSKIYFWVQGANDLSYLRTFTHSSKIQPIYGLENYTKLLNSKKTDYVGTRLHAGIYAMQHGARSIIIAIDNRTKDMKKTYDLPGIDRQNIQNLSKCINSSFATNIHIDNDRIEQWKSQFINPKDQ